MPEPGFHRAISIIRGGLALGALAAVLLAIAPSSDLVAGAAAPPQSGIYVAGIGGSVSALGAAGAVVILVAIALRLLWLHLVALVLTTAVALAASLLVITARISDNIAGDADVSMRAGAWILVAAFWIALAGVVVTLVGVRTVALGGPAPNMPRTGPQQRARTAPTAAIFGLLGVVIVITSSLGVAFGTLALGDIRASAERLTGRPMALTGLISGILVLSLLATIGGVGMLVASPG
jgi:hypothetical protein